MNVRGYLTGPLDRSLLNLTWSCGGKLVDDVIVTRSYSICGEVLLRNSSPHPRGHRQETGACKGNRRMHQLL